MTTVNDEDKQLLTSRYGDLKWVESLPSKFQCNRCDKALITHFIANCEHIFCLNCKNILSDENKNRKCPLCLEIVQEIDRHNDKLEQKLYEKPIYCANKKYGCSTVNTLKELASHLKVCDYKEENILPAIFNGKQARDEILKEVDKFKKNLKKLLADVTAVQEKLLKIESQKNDDKNKFDKKVEKIKKIVSEREREIAEIKSNSESRLDTLEIQQKESKQQPDINLGQLAKEITISAGSNKNDVKSKLAQLESRVLFMKLKARSTSLLDDLWQSEANYDWHITDIKNKLSRGGFELESEPFQLPYYSMSAKAKLQLNADDIFLMSLGLTSENDKLPIGFDIPPAVYYILKSQNKNHDFDITLHSFYSLGAEINFKSAFLRQIMEKAKANDAEYNVNDSLKLEIRVEPPEVAKSAYSYDGTLLWAIDNYEKRKKMEDENFVDGVFTPYFYTSPRGHRVQAHICLNGNDAFEGVGVTFKIMFLNGGCSRKEFHHKTTITIINASEPSDYYTKTVERDIKDNAVYSVNICKYKEIERFTKKDTLFFKIKIVSLEENPIEEEMSEENNSKAKEKDEEGFVGGQFRRVGARVTMLTKFGKKDPAKKEKEKEKSKDKSKEKEKK